MSRNANGPTPRRGGPAWSGRARQMSAASRSSPLYASMSATGGGTGGGRGRGASVAGGDASVDGDASTVDASGSQAETRARYEKRCNIAIEDKYSPHDVLLNLDLFGGEVRAGTLVAITVVKPGGANGPNTNGGADKSAMSKPPEPLRLDGTGGPAEGFQRTYVCVARDMSREVKARMPTTEILVVKHIADAFGLKRGVPVMLMRVDAGNRAIEATHVEISFKDQYLARSDMWRMTVDELMQRTVYKGQSVLFMGTIKAQVTAVFVDGRKVHSAFFAPDTRPILRSESARYVLLIQMAREMWDFDTEGSGEILFNKVVNGFLPTLFKKWALLKAKHLVSIVLFARVEYDAGLTTQLSETSPLDGGGGGGGGGSGPRGAYYTGVLSGGSRRPYKDFYRVVVNEMASMEWATILYQLRKEFNYFRRDVSLFHQRPDSGFAPPAREDPSADEEGPSTAMMLPSAAPSNRVKAIFSQAMYGNFLEAINLVSGQFAHDYIDRDLVRTGISIVVLSPGSGVYEVEYDMLRRTTEALVSNGIAIDLICTSKLPLHSAPLFKYRNPQAEHAPYYQGQGHYGGHHHPHHHHHPSQYTTHSSLSNKMIMRSSRESTPTQNTPLVGSYHSYRSIGGGSTSPTKGPLFLRNNMHTDEWCYAIPQWLHVGYWDGSSEDALDYQGIALSVPGHQLDGQQQADNGEFSMRCRMYELQMRSVLETNEIETAPLYTDPAFPRAAVERFSDAAVRAGKRRTTPEGLFDHIYGMNRFPEWIAKNPEDSLWRRLQEFDDARAKVSTTRRLPVAGVSRHVHRDSDDRRADDYSNLFGSSYSDRRAVGLSSGRKLSMNAYEQPPPPPPPPPLLHNNPPLTTEPPTSTVASSASSITTVSNSTRDSKKNSDGTPKSMRQISLTSRGFGVAAPKAAAASLHVEAVNAHKVPMLENKLLTAPSVRPSSRSSTASTPIIGALAITQNAMRAKGFDAMDSMPATPSIPIIRRSPTPLEAPAASSIASDMTSSTRGMHSHNHHQHHHHHHHHGGGSSTAGGGGHIRDDRDERYSNALRAEDAQKVFTNKLRSGGHQELPATISPHSAVAPWLTVINPSNPDAHKISDTALYSRWQHVFPRTSDMRLMKWKALCCPASVPLTTEYFPTRDQFDTEYQRHPYNIDPTDDDEVDEPKSREECLRELISVRLSQGFQVVIGPAVARAFGLKHLKVADIFSRDQVLEDGTSVFMSLGNTIHQLSCVNGTEIEVNIFMRKAATSTTDEPSRAYKPAIRTLFDQSFSSVEYDITTRTPDRNWNTLDTYLAGQHDDMSESLRFWRARFVLIPMEARSFSVPFGGGAGSRDSPEEVRIEGIRRLTQGWEKHRHVPPSERRFSTPAARKRANPLDIVYKTDDPSVVISQELDQLPLVESDGIGAVRRRGGLVTVGGSRRRFAAKAGLNLNELAEAMQQPVEAGGVRMQNRRWHLKLHYNCFIGSDMVTWLLDNFDDLETREEAEALGNLFMVVSNEEDGETKEKEKERDKDSKEKDKLRHLFVHVARRHPFRDGNYFYQIVPEFSSKHQNAGWFGPKRRETIVPTPTVPSTPLTESSGSISGQSRQGTGSGGGSGGPVGGISSGLTRPHDDGPSGTTTPTSHLPPLSANFIKQRPRVMLSKMIKYDVDHRRRSYRPERINLHYDRLHNPDNCYHIRLDWINVTAKLIEDAIESWAREALAFGMRLVEVPIKEAASITDTAAFRRAYEIKLALQPPREPPPAASSSAMSSAHWEDAASAQPSPAPLPSMTHSGGTHHPYQHAILKRFNFVLDVEAASNFPPNVDVMYSWGRPDFRYSQYIHRSGVLLAQITDDGNFLMLANNLYSNRAQAAREKELRGAIDQQQQQQQQQQQHQQGGAPPPPTPGPLDRSAARSISSSIHCLKDPTPLNSPMIRPLLFTPSPATNAAKDPPPSAGFPSVAAPATSSAAPTVPSTADGPGPTPVFAFAFPFGGEGLFGGGRDDRREGGFGGGGGGGGTHAMHARQSTASALGVVSMSECIRDDVEAFCHDVSALEEFYQDLLDGNGVPASVGFPMSAGLPSSGFPMSAGPSSAGFPLSAGPASAGFPMSAGLVGSVMDRGPHGFGYGYGYGHSHGMFHSHTAHYASHREYGHGQHHRHISGPATPVVTGFQAGGATGMTAPTAGAVPEASIPTLGLPPGVMGREKDV